MNAEVFAVWLRRQGYRVVHTASGYGDETNPHVYRAFPNHGRPHTYFVADFSAHQGFQHGSQRAPHPGRDPTRQ